MNWRSILESKILLWAVLAILSGWIIVGGYHQAFPQANPGFHQGYVGPSRSWDERFQPYPWIRDYSHNWDI